MKRYRLDDKGSAAFERLRGFPRTTVRVTDAEARTCLEFRIGAPDSDTIDVQILDLAVIEAIESAGMAHGSLPPKAASDPPKGKRAAARATALLAALAAVLGAEPDSTDKGTLS